MSHFSDYAIFGRRVPAVRPNLLVLRDLCVENGDMKAGPCAPLFLCLLTSLALVGQSPPSETSDRKARTVTQQASPETHRGQISGRVYRADTREPAVGLTVLALRLEFELDGSRNLFAYAKSITDDQGGFRFDKLRGGPYFLGTGGLPQRSPGSEPGLKDADHRAYYGETYYPENALSETAEPIAVKLGTEVNGIQIPVRPVQTYTIRGRVEGAATSVFAERVKGRHLFGLPQARPLPDGSFTIGEVVLGDYVITAIAVHEGRGIPSTVVRGYAKVKVANADAWANVRLGEAGRVRGTAMTEGPSRLILRDLEIGLSNPLEGDGLDDFAIGSERPV